MTSPVQENSGASNTAERHGVGGQNTLETSSMPGDAQRQDQRVASPRVRVSVVKKSLFGAREIAFCDLLDLSRGGVCLASQWLHAKLDQKLDMELYHGHQTFPTRGIVTRVDAAELGTLYGIAFIFAPPELDRLIEAFLQERATEHDDQSLNVARAEKRQTGSRLAAPDAQIYVKRIGSTDPFVRCEVDNISKGGLGFYCPTRIAAKAPFRVSVQISDSPTAGVITGTVHYMGKKLDQFYYGMEYELVSAELVRLLERLDRSDQPTPPV